MSDRDAEMVKLREQRDDAIQRVVLAEQKLAILRVMSTPDAEEERSYECCQRVIREVRAVLEADDV